MSVNHKGPIINPGLCRCCGALKKCRVLNVQYEWLGQKEIYSEMFVEVFGLLLSHLDGEADGRLICATCVSRLREASCFRQQVLHCEERLLSSRIQVHGDNKVDEIKTEDTFKSERKHSRLINKSESCKLDNVGEDASSGIGMISPELVKRKRKKTNVRKTVDIKKRRTKQNQLKTQDEPPLIPNNFEDDEALWNVLTIVENSYVCPFNNFFNIYYCVYCRQRFRDPNNLRQHCLAHEPSIQQIINSSPSRKNKKIQLDLYRIDCRLCDKKIDDINTFKHHITIHGKTIYPVTDYFLKFRLTQNNLKCTECDLTFAFFHALKKHMAEHFGEYICDVCGVHYFEERMLVAHQKTHQPSENRYLCKQCGKSFKMKYNLHIHTARLHTKEAVYLCSKCDETFFSNTLRHKHMIEVHGEESIFKCEHCDKVYDSIKTLRDHNRRIHLKLFKHQCHLCEKRFYLPCRLKEHMSSHTGERNFRCENCGKSYPRLRALKVHMQSHSTEKKYKCTICNASYSQNVCLKNHIKRQHQNLPSEESFEVLS